MEASISRLVKFLEWLPNVCMKKIVAPIQFHVFSSRIQSSSIDFPRTISISKEISPTAQNDNWMR